MVTRSIYLYELGDFEINVIDIILGSDQTHYVRMGNICRKQVAHMGRPG